MWLLQQCSRVAQFPDMVKGLSPPALNLLNFTHFFAPLASHRLVPRQSHSLASARFLHVADDVLVFLEVYFAF
ncbi:hypothetical protein E2C01_099233 [Portunus trituberculatus]|uniref:Uncharacterized protein n=1 Tax=Portunus trituberculatus TaxID=210409 RepID=A0A5B7JZT6_PORTR|nr:hypothetical protein [Portunus trituberculatus]